jgi:hypothetical protein
MGFRLELTSGRGAGKSFFFASNSVSIGRHADNDLVVYDTGVSRHHCVVSGDDRGWVITDESSANGTFVNDVMTRRSQLRQGDLLQIGPLVFRFMLAEGPTGWDSTSPLLFAPGSDVGVIELEGIDTEAHDASKASELISQLDGAKGRTLTGSFVARGRSGFKKGSTWILGIALGLFLVAGIAFYGVVEDMPRDRSGELFDLNSETGQWRFGAEGADIYAPSRVNLQFESRGERSRVKFLVWGTRTDDELAVLINGVRVGYAPRRSQLQPVEAEFILEPRYLISGTNVLSFVYTSQAGSARVWGVRSITIELVATAKK